MHKHICRTYTHTQLHTHIVSAHDPVHYCYWTTGWWMVNRLACLEERTVVKPAVNCFLYHESKINFETHYLYGWFKGTLWEEMRILFPISSFSLHVFICVCVYIHACVNVLCVFVCISLSKVNLIVMWTIKNIYNVVFKFCSSSVNPDKITGVIAQWRNWVYFKCWSHQHSTLRIRMFTRESNLMKYTTEPWCRVQAWELDKSVNCCSICSIRRQDPALI